MNYFDTFVFIIELISITSFAISGALTAIRKNFDVFGVIIVSVTTAIGGGIIRDLILGINPPMSFRKPVYAAISAFFALGTFIVEYRHSKHRTISAPIAVKITDAIMFWLDSIGLAIFTVVGVATAYSLSNDYNAYLLCFVGTITGVGGGIMRDLFTGSMPYIFVKHFYATACIAGSIVCVILWQPAGRIIAMLSGTFTVILLRVLAAHFRWNLPHVPTVDEAEKREKNVGQKDKIYK
ncbi:MAG: trimeric intracellular cation channel family protein [Eubacteriales bacterium]